VEKDVSSQIKNVNFDVVSLLQESSFYNYKSGSDQFVALRLAEVILTYEKQLRNVVPPLTVIHAELEGMDLGCPAWFAFHPQAHQQVGTGDFH